MNPSPGSLLNAVPDFFCESEATVWFQEGQRLISEYSGIPAETEVAFLDWKDIAEASRSPLGLYSSKVWRKFVFAAFLADWVSYLKPVDQVSFNRLLFVMHAFPQGFRVVFSRMPQGQWWPVGYSGWYPVAETTFDLMDQKAENLKDRWIFPTSDSIEKAPFFYLFNYSVVGFLKGTFVSKHLIQQLSQDILSHQFKGLACITVSGDGARVATRFGMTQKGTLNLQGEVEAIYTFRRKSE